MINYVSGIVFVVGLVITGVFCAPLLEARPGLAVLTGLAGLVIDSAVASSIRIAAQWERGVVFRLGRFLGVRGPGIYLIIPLFDQVRMVDMRVRAVNIDKQQVITKDNVPMSIDGVLFYKVEEAEHAVIRAVKDKSVARLLDVGNWRVESFHFSSRSSSQFPRSTSKTILGVWSRTKPRTSSRCSPLNAFSELPPV